MADFRLWQHDSLARFAQEAAEKMVAQQREIFHLEILLAQEKADSGRRNTVDDVNQNAAQRDVVEG
jgi:hypothetical protein